MAEADEQAAPTGAFGEGATERPADEAPAASYSRDTAVHVSRRRRGEASDGARDGTAEHVQMIDRLESAS